MFGSAVLCCVCVLAIQVGSNVIRSPQSPSLTFQVAPNGIPPSGDEPLETWPSSYPDLSSSNPRLNSASGSPQYQPLPSAPVVPASVWYRTLLPNPVGFVQNALNRFFAFVMVNNALKAYHHHLPEPIDCSKYTIAQVLNWTLHHTPKPSVDDSHHPPPLHRLAWLVNVSRSVQEALDDPDADFTLFAPDDKALTPPWEKKHHSRGNELNNAYAPTQKDQGPDPEASNIFWEALEAIEKDSEIPPMPQVDLETGEHDDDKEKKKKFFLHAIEMVLKYHVSPGRKTLREIVDSSTLPSELPIMPDSKAARFRVRVGLPLPNLHEHGLITLNFASTLQAFKTRPIIAKNGIIYIIERSPLLPPLSPLSQLFLFPQTTSTLTTALQKTHLDDALLPHWENKTIPLSTDSKLDSSSLFGDSVETVDERVQSVLSSLIEGHDGKLKKESFTIFAPNNHAFRSLGLKANMFLFSPFGQHILRYVLSYHIVPHVIWNTDHCDEVKHGQTGECDLESKTYRMVETLPSFVPHPVQNRCFYPHLSRPQLPRKVNVTELLLPTLLGSRANESLPISLVEFRHFKKGPLIRRVYIKSNNKHLTFGSPDKHAIPVIISDAVAWGGALHLIPKLIHPPVPEGHHHRKDVQRALELSILTAA